MTHLLTLTDGSLRVLLAPEIGGSIARCDWVTDAGITPWLRPASEASIKVKQIGEMACFPMVPFCGRTKDGHFTTQEGDLIQLPAIKGHAHALHGIGWLRPWEVLSNTSSAARLVLEMSKGEWPYPFIARQWISLQDQQLHIHLSVQNLSDHTLPFGAGLHPYFPRDTKTRLTTQANGHWAVTPEILAVAPVEDPALLKQLAEGCSPDSVVLDHTFFGWEQKVLIDQPSTHLTLTASHCATHLAIYTPKNEDYFCLEPCSQVPGFPNLTQFSQNETGGHWLSPGETLSVSMALSSIN